MTETDTQKRDKKNIELSRGSIVSILLYYLVITLLSGSYAMKLLVEHQKDPATSQSLYFCISFSIVGAAIFYTRKLYKACISDEYTFAKSDSTVKMVGSFTFFIARPIFGLFFAWISYMIWEIATISSVEGFTKFSPTHFYFSGVFGFFIGFLAGRIVARMEDVGDRHLGGIW